MSTAQRLLAFLIDRHARRAGHNWFIYYRSSERWWNLRLWCGDPDRTISAMYDINPGKISGTFR